MVYHQWTLRSMLFASPNLTFQSNDRSSRFRPAELDNWPIDLMYVESRTFQIIYEGATLKEFGQIEALVASIEHLIYLKMHALKHYQEHRFSKDMSDLISLIVLARIDVGGDEFRQQCLKFASLELYEKIIREIPSERKEKTK